MDLFQRSVPYREDLYENKEDVRRNQYVEHRTKILNQQRPYTSTVRQRGTFYSEKLTFGSDREFPHVRDSCLNRSETKTNQAASVLRAFQESRPASPGLQQDHRQKL